MQYLDGDEAGHNLEPTVVQQGLGNHQQSVGECLDAELGPSLDLLLKAGDQVVVRGQLKGAGALNQRLVVEQVLDTAEPVADGVDDLTDGVVVGAADEDGAAGAVFAALDKSVLVVPELVLVDQVGVALRNGRK